MTGILLKQDVKKDVAFQNDDVAHLSFHLKEFANVFCMWLVNQSFHKAFLLRSRVRSDGYIFRGEEVRRLCFYPGLSLITCILSNAASWSFTCP